MDDILITNLASDISGTSFATDTIELSFYSHFVSIQSIFGGDILFLIV